MGDDWALLDDPFSAPRGAGRFKRRKHSCAPSADVDADYAPGDQGSVPRDADTLSSARKGAEQPEVAVPPSIEGDDRPRDRALRDEAITLAHCLVHKPKNPYCDVCTRTRTRQVRHVAGAYDRPTQAWGISSPLITSTVNGSK